MIVVIAGSRELDGEELVDAAVRASGFEITAVKHGNARGIDRAAGRWAKKRGIPVEVYPAEWDAGDLGAGHQRNGSMLDDGAEALLAIWDGVSGGTGDVIEKAKARKLRYFVYRVSEAID